MDGEPSGYILVNDHPMAFWLPDGVLPEDIGVIDVPGDMEEDSLSKRLLSVEESPPF